MIGLAVICLCCLWWTPCSEAQLLASYNLRYGSHKFDIYHQYKWFSFLVSKSCTYAVVRKSFWLSTMNNIKDNIYWHAIGQIFSFLNRLPLEDLGPTPDITLTTLFCSLNTWCACVEFPQKIIPYWSTEWKYAKYTTLKISGFILWIKFLIEKHAALNLGRIYSTWFFQFIWSSTCMPTNLVLSYFIYYIILIINIQRNMCCSFLV